MYSRNGVSIDKVVYGFGGQENYNGFTSASLVNQFNFDGVPANFIPINTIFMPFANINGVDGLFKDGELVLPNYVFAATNRFVVDNIVRYGSSSDTGSTRIEVSYTGGGSETSLGTLKIGSRVFLNCPPVICVAVQGRGGNGGRGNNLNLILGWSASCGGGGGSGAYTLLQFKFPTDPVEKVCFYYSIVNGKDVCLYRDLTSSAFCVARCGLDGADGLGSSSTGGLGGKGGTVSLLTSTVLLNGVEFRKFFITTADGSGTSYNGTMGLMGGQGGGQGGIIIGISLVNLVGYGGANLLKNVYLNNRGTQILRDYDSGYGGSSGMVLGGGGAGSIMGHGGNSADGANWGHGYGAGGAGGNAWATGSSSGGAGAPARIEFIW